MATFIKAPVLPQESIDPNSDYFTSAKAMLVTLQDSTPVQFAAAYWPVLLLPTLAVGLVLVRKAAARHAAAQAAELDEMEPAAT